MSMRRWGGWARVAGKGGLLLAGAAVVGWILGRVGWGKAWGLIVPLGWNAPWLLLPYLTVYLTDGMGWRWTLPAGLGVGFPRLLAIRWAGEAVNNVVPSGHVGGEMVKVYLLGRLGVATSVTGGAAILSKTAQTLAQLIFVCLAAACFGGLVPAGSGWRQAMAVTLAGAAAAVAAMLWMQARGVFATLSGALRWMGRMPDWLARREGTLRAMDGQVSAFYRNHRGRLAASVGHYLAGWMLDACEIWLAGQLMGERVSWPQAVSVEGFVGIVKLASMWVPGAVGVQEGGILVLGRAVGLGETFCVAYAVLRRAREAVFAAVGWVLLWSHHVNLRQVDQHNSEVPPGNELG